MKPLTPTKAAQMLKHLPGWKRKGKTIHREFTFKDYYQTIEFVNAVAWIANKANHHPDLIVGYNKCHVSYSTHDAGGLTEKDFVSATMVGALVM